MQRWKHAQEWIWYQQPVDGLQEVDLGSQPRMSGQAMAPPPQKKSN